jgi:hypothetical protein
LTKLPYPGATVEATNKETGLKLSNVTDGQGFYQILNLPTGIYSVSVTLEGFVTATSGSVRVFSPGRRGGDQRAPRAGPGSPRDAYPSRSGHEALTMFRDSGMLSKHREPGGTEARRYPDLPYGEVQNEVLRAAS